MTSRQPLCPYNSDLDLPAELTNPQTGWVSEIAWESNSAAVAVDGKVSVPEKQGAEVTLKAATGGESKTFTFYVPASAPEGNTLICVGDSDTANGAGVVQDV